jgi:O-antigen/teichoic acid export membrane protein
VPRTGEVEVRTPTRLRISVASAFLANACTLLLSIAFLPLYLRLLGPEAFGLAGLFNMLLGVLGFFDFGLAMALQRECARARTDAREAKDLRDLARTTEILFWASALVVAGLAVVLSPWVATHWFKPHALPAGELTAGLMLLGLALGLRWPYALYTNGLLGLERQLQLNILRTLFAVFQWAGAAALLAFVAADIRLFLGWQAFVGALLSVVSARLFWRSLPGAGGAFSPAAVKAVSGFSGGVGTSNLVAFAVGQADKLLLARLLSLETFGYYALAHSLASAIGQVVGPIAGAVFPRITHRVSTGHGKEARSLYHLGSQAFAALAVPAAVVMAAFATAILALWTGDGRAGQQAGPVLAVLALGMAVNGLIHFPQLAQLAHGQVRLGLQANVVGAILYLPALVWATSSYGAIGAACCWLALQLAFLTVFVPVAHRQVFPGELAHWYLWSVLAPGLASGVIAFTLSTLLVPSSTPPIEVLVIALALASGTVAAVALSPSARSWLISLRRTH